MQIQVFGQNQGQGTPKSQGGPCHEQVLPDHARAGVVQLLAQAIAKQSTSRGLAIDGWRSLAQGCEGRVCKRSTPQSRVGWGVAVCRPGE
eukprot:232621-Lingulodinium_polyedra.AAC.1